MMRFNPVEIKIGSNRFSGCIDNEGKYYSASEVVTSWGDGFRDKHTDDVTQTGLRAPQFGALSAIRAHWTVKNNPATIVMPTGTGKSETMLATIVAESINRTLIIVPSKLLRTQMYQKAQHWGILYDSQNLADYVLPPNTLVLNTGMSNSNQFQEWVLRSNIVITTMHLANIMTDNNKKFLSEVCNLLVIDEAHHISSKTWAQFKINFLNLRIMQFTATPFRNDGKKIDGDIIYNFPLALAQQQGYFKEIEFVPVEEFNQKKQDLVIAEKAIKILQQDLDLDYNHLLLVRVETIDRAETLYKEIYSLKYSKYKPVLIVNETPQKLKNENMNALKSGESKIVVCVNMFGEGIDIPNLKIAAIHDKYKSMPITLQFIGRFARSQKGLGSAKIIANIADENIVEAIEDLYQKDTDWNKLLPIKSNEFINKEISLQDLANKFSGDAKNLFSFQLLRPKVSMLSYLVGSEDWHWERWTDEFDESKCFHLINQEDKILVVIEPRETSVDWTTQQSISNLEWNLYVVYWNQNKGVAFVNSSDRSKGFHLAQAIWNVEIETIKSEKIFKCLYGINRLALATVGLNSGIDGPIRYKMFAGIDVAEGITDANKSNCYKSNIFGIGFSDGNKVSIGCSHKGTIWARWVETIDYWKEWCDEIITKVLDENIDVTKVLDGVLIPQVVQSFSSLHPYRIDWPNDMDYLTDSCIRIINITGEYGIEELEIGLLEENYSEDELQFFIKNDSFIEKFKYSLNEKGFVISSLGNVSCEIKAGRDVKIPLYKFFMDNPPTIWFPDGSSIQGNVRLSLSKHAGAHLNDASIFTWKWFEMGVDIHKESQLDKSTKLKRQDSIQYAVINEMKKSNSYNIIFDDDGSGEIADVIGIKEIEKEITIDFYHCKYSHGENPGARVADLYEVCGQAEKSVAWKAKPIEMLNRMIDRERKRLSDNNPSRFELGDIDKAREIKRKMQMRPSKICVNIVQPGVLHDTMTDEMKRLLSTTQSYCFETYAVVTRFICS